MPLQFCSRDLFNNNNNNNRFTMCTLWSLVFIPLGDARGFNNPIIIVKLCDLIMLACVHACVFTCTCGFCFFLCVCVWVWVCACMWSIYILVPFVFYYWPLSPGCVCVCVVMAGFNQMLCFTVLIVLYENDWSLKPWESYDHALGLHSSSNY